MVKSRKNRGFSLTEVMVSTVLVGGMTVGLTYLIGRGSESRRLEEKKIQLVQTSKYLEAKIRKDLSSTIRTTGNTRKTFEGINMLEDLDPVRFPNGGLGLIVERFGQFSTPADVTLIGNDPTKPALIMKLDENDPAAEYISSALTKNKLFLMGNLQYSNIVRITGAPVRVGSNPERIQFPIQNSNFNRTEHSSQTNNLRTLEVVTYFLKDGKVYRDVYVDLPVNSNVEPVESAVLAEDVSQFDFSFAFEDRRQANLVVPKERLRHPKLYRESEGCSPNNQQNCCSSENLNDEKCITMNDVRDVQMNATFNARDPKFRQQEGTGDGFRALNGLLQYSTQVVLIPLRYDLRGGVIGLVGQSLNCPMNDYASRCKAECAGDNGPFKNRSLNADGSYPADWWEYGDLNSNYCKCGTINGTFAAPEVNPYRTPVWDADLGPNQPIEYCAKHFPSCSGSGGTSWIMGLYPQAMLSCYCIQPRPLSLYNPQTPYYSRKMTSTNADYGEFVLNLPRSLSSTDHILNNLNTDVQNENNMFCYIYTPCDAAAQSWFTDLESQTPWLDRCSCAVNNVEADGQIGNVAVHRQFVDWNKICNSDFVQGRSQTPACSQSIDPATKSYRLKSASNPQGLTEADAAFCACFNEEGYSSTDAPFTSQGNPNYLDFRRGSPLQDPNLPSEQVPNYSDGSPASFFGAKTSLAVAVNALRIENGVTQSVPVGGSCDRVFCDIRHPAGIALGCCTANRPVASSGVRILQSRPQLAQVLNGTSGNYLDYVSYCSPECVSSKTLNIPGRGSVNEVQRIREIITGTPSGQEVPPICGQESGGSIGGN